MDSLFDLPESLDAVVNLQLKLVYEAENVACSASASFSSSQWARGASINLPRSIESTIHNSSWDRLSEITVDQGRRKPSPNKCDCLAVATATATPSLRSISVIEIARSP